jgi:integrase/recombinase XerD
MDLEKLLETNNKALLAQIAALLPQQNTGGIEMPRKLKYGQGCIVKRRRKNKTNDYYEWYQVSWIDEYGKRHYSTAKTQLEALDILKENNKRSLKNSRKHLKTFKEAMMEWYNAFRKDNACDERNKTNIREINRLPDKIANKPLQAVTAQELQDHLNSIKNDSPRITAKTMLCSFLRYMFLQNTIKKDFGLLLKAPHPHAAEKQVLTTQDEPRFLELLPEKFRKYAVGLIYTGCRYSEFINIQAEDVDRINRIITIRETKSLRANDRRRGIKYNTRIIPLLPILEDYNFPLPYISQAYFQKAFKDASAKLGIKVTPHDMRHTFATRCDDLGVKEKVIQSILGHKHERMTRHYKNHKTAELIKSEYAKITGGPDKGVILVNHPMLNYENYEDQIEADSILDHEEEAKFIQSFPESWRDHITAMIYTGCSFAEMSAIREEDINRIEKTIFIQEIKIGRDASPARTIPLLPPVEQISFPLEKRSPKYFINCFHVASERLGKKVLAKDLIHVYTARLKEYQNGKSTPISTPLCPENALKTDINEGF